MKAIILCAGFGTRMNQYTKTCPKPMLPIGGIPLLEHTILQLKKNQINEIGVNLHYLADQITDYFGDGSKFGVKITYVYEKEPTGTAGGVLALSEFLQGSERFFVVYGDIYTGHSYRDHLAFHQNNDATASIVLHQRQNSNSIVDFDKNHCVKTFIERPSAELMKEYSSSWVNSAIYLLNRSVLDMISEDKVVDFPKDIFPKLVELGVLYGLPLESYRVAIDNPTKYQEAKDIASSHG